MGVFAESWSKACQNNSNPDTASLDKRGVSSSPNFSEPPAFLSFWKLPARMSNTAEMLLAGPKAKDI